MDLVSTPCWGKYDVNSSKAVNIVDAYLILKQAGLISIEPPVLPKQATTMLLGLLKAQYGPQLVKYQTLEGRTCLFCLIYFVFKLYY